MGLADDLATDKGEFEVFESTRVLIMFFSRCKSESRERREQKRIRSIRDSKCPGGATVHVERSEQIGCVKVDRQCGPYPNHAGLLSETWPPGIVG